MKKSTVNTAKNAVAEFASLLGVSQKTAADALLTKEAQEAIKKSDAKAAPKAAPAPKADKAAPAPAPAPKVKNAPKAQEAAPAAEAAKPKARKPKADAAPAPAAAPAAPAAAAPKGKGSKAPEAPVAAPAPAPAKSTRKAATPTGLFDNRKKALPVSELHPNLPKAVQAYLERYRNITYSNVIEEPEAAKKAFVEKSKWHGFDCYVYQQGDIKYGIVRGHELGWLPVVLESKSHTFTPEELSFKRGTKCGANALMHQAIQAKLKAAKPAKATTSKGKGSKPAQTPASGPQMRVS